MAEEGKVSLSFEYLFGNLQQTLEGGFNRLDRSIEEVRRSLDGKASIESVAAVKKELAALEERHEQQAGRVDERFKPIEIAIATDAGVSTWKIRLGNAAVLFAASSVGAFLTYIASHFGHHG